MDYYLFIYLFLLIFSCDYLANLSQIILLDIYYYAVLLWFFIQFRFFMLNLCIYPRWLFEIYYCDLIAWYLLIGWLLSCYTSYTTHFRNTPQPLNNAAQSICSIFHSTWISWSSSDYFIANWINISKTNQNKFIINPGEWQSRASLAAQSCHLKS